jgi:hypothetical protein
MASNELGVWYTILIFSIWLPKEHEKTKKIELYIKLQSHTIKDRYNYEIGYN